jgi:hypothetical protein
MPPSIPHLKQGEIKGFRESLLEQQEGICPLCELEVTPEEAVLDHCYDTGHVRAVLHRSCNGAEGQIKKWAGQRSKGKCQILFTENLVSYWKKDWTGNPYHPKHGKTTKKKRPTRRGKKRGKTSVKRKQTRSTKQSRKK